VPRVVGVKDGLPLLADGRVREVQNVIWSTGYSPGFDWIDLPIFNQAGDPLHDKGIVADVPGLYFVGLHFLYSMTSATLTGVGRDAERVVKALATQQQRITPLVVPPKREVNSSPENIRQEEEIQIA
jgi:putative flavoprotein involved in K+ transport